MELLTGVFKALADRNRLRMLAALMRYDELCACQLIELIQVTGATASRHMGVLIASGLVASRKEGRWVYYRLCREKAEYHSLISWIEARLKISPDAEKDAKTLTTIMAFDPEDLCRKQHGESCCPPK
ncbi:MAG: winged helix-turn-helix transcriptional regulator [Acidobacteria bacterium]|nr:winged helix-turn-helix transcriptional regulator [Acidobacteriota bacterium]